MKTAKIIRAPSIQDEVKLCQPAALEQTGSSVYLIQKAIIFCLRLSVAEIQDTFVITIWPLQILQNHKLDSQKNEPRDLIMSGKQKEFYLFKLLAER